MPTHPYPPEDHQANISKYKLNKIEHQNNM